MLFLEEMAADPLGALSDVFDFLGMDFIVDDEDERQKKVGFVRASYLFESTVEATCGTSFCCLGFDSASCRWYTWGCNTFVHYEVQLTPS